MRSYSMRNRSRVWSELKLESTSWNSVSSSSQAMVSIPNQSASLSIVVSLLNNIIPQKLESSPLPPLQLPGLAAFDGGTSAMDTHRLQLQYQGRMNPKDLHCCLCEDAFLANSQPRMMPSCQHSACTPCLKKIINSQAVPSIQCRYCGQRESIAEADLEYFPKNISLTKTIREKEASSISCQPQETPKKAGQSAVEGKPEVEKCTLHNKEIEIICLTDRERLCPHCALFGKHKNHSFKTLIEAEEEMKERRRLFQHHLHRKDAIRERFEGSQFKEALILKINTEKERIILDIKAKFTALQDNIRLAEKMAFEDLSKNYKVIYRKISNLLKEEKECQVRFKDWEGRCKKLIAEAEAKKTLEERVSFYYGGPLEECSHGQGLLLEIEDKMKADLSVIEQLIGSVRISENREVGNSLFNFLSLYTESESIDLITQAREEVILPKNMAYQSPKVKLEFSSAQSFGLTRSDSPWSPKSGSHGMEKTQFSSTPNKNIPSQDKKTIRTSEKRKAGQSPDRFESSTSNVEKMVEEFCSRDNLDTLDLTAYSLSDSDILDVLRYLKPLKRIKGLKLVKNNLTNEGLSRMVELIPGVTNLNLSFNQLGEEALSTILGGRQMLPLLRIINISNNKINERKAKATVEELKRQGIIVTI